MKDVKQKPSVAYYLLRKYSNAFVFRWFSEVDVNGKENTPQDSPCIILPCHQNALMDCLTVIAVFKKPITFFAKSSLFVNTLVSNFLIFLRIMPAYRQQDGLQKVAKNEDNFLKAVDLLLHGFPLCIMPEGGQEEKHNLRPFAKGPFRIALYAQEKLPEDKSIYLIPVGLDYGNYDKAGYPLVLNIAKPIDVRSYMSAYKDNPAKTLNLLKEEAYQSLSKNMLDIQSENYYDVIYKAAYLYNYSMLKKLNLEDNQTNRFKARQVIAKRLDEIVVTNLSEMQLLAEKYNSLLKKDIDFISIANNYPKQQFVFLLPYVILFFPVFLYGFLLNFLVILLVWILEPKLKNSGFTATMKYAVFILFSPVNHLLFSVLVAVITSLWLVPLIIFLTGMPITVFCKKYIEKFRILKNIFLRNKYKKEISEICIEINKTISK